MSGVELPPIVDSSSLGAHLVDGGAAFALWAPRATRVELALVAEDRTQRNVDMVRGEDGVWAVTVPDIEAEQMYGFRVHGEWDPDTGQRFNPAKLLLDPYARAITYGVDYAGPIRDHVSGDDFELDETDSALAVPLAVVVADTPPPTPIAEPIALRDSVIYELHVKGFTQLHPAVPEHLRGRYGGLAYPAVVEYLQGLGITAVELLPVHHHISEPFLIGRGLTNYWGYNTLGFFAPHAAYGSVGTKGEQVAEFKAMVSTLHEAGIEVILDVVYNHTGEGGHEGPTLAFRGIDHGGYYRLTEDLRNDYDVTGCGNSVDSSQPGVLTMILDSMRYWVTEMGVDGFRFDLATTLLRNADHEVDQQHAFKQAVANDPVLSKIKLIAEPWDVGPFGYQVGNFGPGWGEWNDHFRGYVRDHWRGATPGVRELAERLCGSPGTYDHDRGPEGSINFVTSHDGFTLADLVTYDGKHNEANGEENRDGSDDNRSWNCGHEGPTDDPGVNALRHRQAKNIMATLAISTGVPMLTAGDEFGRTQQGNNNAYCQDSPISWVHWDQQEDWADLLELTRTLLHLRRENASWRPDAYRHGVEVVSADGTPTGRKDLAWFNGIDLEMNEGDWADENRRCLGMYVSDADSAFLTWFHSGTDTLDVALPGEPWAQGWTVAAHTGEPDEFGDDELNGSLHIPPRTVVVLRARL
ncbi:glycogen debranching protein GlgX [Propionibacteriaceae bacterium Y1700]|uniref:glycogen debranching protein GlgX n=1 Tax=Microlunatus sp. Y1700 TaxID=3418487 RepID=UPI003DA77A52